jgi:hypothetical protein
MMLKCLHFVQTEVYIVAGIKKSFILVKCNLLLIHVNKLIYSQHVILNIYLNIVEYNITHVRLKQI